MSAEENSGGSDAPQVPGGAWYQPYNNNGTWSTILSNEASQLASNFPTGNGVVDYGIQKAAQLGGYEAGRVVDNLSAIEANFNTLVNDLNNWRNWQSPVLGE